MIETFQAGDNTEEFSSLNKICRDCIFNKILTKINNQLESLLKAEKETFFNQELLISPKKVCSILIDGDLRIGETSLEIDLKDFFKNINYGEITKKYVDLIFDELENY